jgi:hypothetical protein
MRACTCVSLALIVILLASCAPLPSAQPADLAPYRSAMLPEAEADVDQVGDAPRYDIALSIDPDGLAATGHASILYTNRQAKSLKDLYFRLYPNLAAYDGDLVVTRVQIGEQDLATYNEAQRSALRVPLPSELRPGRALRLEMDFHVRFKRKEAGRVLFGDSLGVLSLPDAYPMLAVCDNGTWNLSIGPDFADAAFGDVALYHVKLTVPRGMVVATSGVVKAESDLPDGGPHQIEVVTGPVREFGLIMSRTYQKQTLKIRGFEINSYYLPADEMMGYSALWRAAAALQAFSDAFGSYPYAKLDVAEAPLAKHGMEYPALILIGSDVYRSDRLKLEPLVAHETAHQWWYNLVGSDPIAAPAVDESLAEYSLWTYYQGVYGRGRAEQVVEQRWTEPYKSAKDSGLDAPVEQAAQSFTKDNYEVIVYAKGALLLNDLRHRIGDDPFDLTVRRYLQNYRYRIAPPGAFLGLASGATPQNLSDESEKWREATTPAPNPTGQPK